MITNILKYSTRLSQILRNPQVDSYRNTHNSAMHYIINTNGMHIGIYQCERDECKLLLSSLMHFEAMRIIVISVNGP